jgi:hypothetical protein
MLVKANRLKGHMRPFSLKCMKRFKMSFCLAALLAASSFASVASANGRFPRAQRLIEDPSDSNKLYLAATYGLMLTNDRGKNWYHVCETAFSFQMGYTGDPVVSLTGNGWLLAGSQASLNLSTDQGCDWKQTLMGPASPKVAYFDFTVAPSAGHPIIAVSSTYAMSGPVNQLQESTDNGMTWKAVGVKLPVAVVNTVDVDPTDPTHIYATGLTTTDDSPDTGRFLVSIDHGMTWKTTTIPNTFAWANPFICGVHPTDPKKIFVRTDGWKDRLNVQTADDALLYSSDGGQTWTEILHPGGPADDSPGAKLFGFAMSPDGSTVLAGYGDPVDGSRLVESTWFGVYKSSSDGKYSFGADTAKPVAMMPVESVSCITWTKNGVYVCMAPQGEPSFLSFAKDATFKVRGDMTTLMKLNETRGVPPNCSGRAASTCNWALDCMTLNACGAGGATTGTGAGGASTGTGAGGASTGTGAGGATTGSGGSGTGPSTGGGVAGATTGGGAGGATGTTVTTTGGGGATGADVTDKPKACNCHAPGSTASGGAQAMAWLAGALFLAQRRRTHRSARSRN